jgi:hypothetical protein
MPKIPPEFFHAHSKKGNDMSTPSNPLITPNQFGPGEQQALNEIVGATMEAIIRLLPRLAPALMSGGTFEIKTMSGMHLKSGFSAYHGGLVSSDGITPINPKRFPRA